MNTLDLIRSAQVGSCTCGTKTPETGFHAAECRYRILDSIALTVFNINRIAERIVAERDLGRAVDDAEQIRRQIERIPFTATPSGEITL